MAAQEKPGQRREEAGARGRRGRAGRQGSRRRADRRGTLREHRLRRQERRLQKLLADLLDLAASKKLGSAEDLAKQELRGRPVSEAVKEQAGKIGENIGLKRVLRFEGAFGYYIHHDSKQGAVVVLEGVEGEKARELGKDLSMHVVFAKPHYMTREQVPAEDVQKEKKFVQEKLKEDPKNAKKPDQILEKIAEGQMQKFYGERCLLEQPYFRENKVTVAEQLKQAGGGAKIRSFALLQVGK
ncbi:MAG: translation elongation factor Ts [Planctomycetota bacterium]|nr:translation elongation factor Ts [Planctomycetota bacterium]